MWKSSTSKYVFSPMEYHLSESLVQANMYSRQCPPILRGFCFCAVQAASVLADLRRFLHAVIPSPPDLSLSHTHNHTHTHASVILYPPSLSLKNTHNHLHTHTHVRPQSLGPSSLACEPTVKQMFVAPKDQSVSAQLLETKLMILRRRWVCTTTTTTTTNNKHWTKLLTN